MTRIQYIIFFSSFLFSSCYITDETPPDQDIWEYSLPSENGLDDAVLLSLDFQIEQGLYEFINGIIITKNDQLIYEDYYNGFDRASIHAIDRASIQLGTISIAIADDLGLLSIDDTISQYLPQYADIFEADPRKNEITIKHLLTYTSSLAWNDVTISEAEPENDYNRTKASSDWPRYLLERNLEAIPGNRFTFNNANALLIPPIIENVSGQTFEAFLNEYLVDPLGITSLSLSYDPSGNADLLEGVSLNLIDWARIGYLVINEGTWLGRRVYNREFAIESYETAVAITSASSYGYFWRLFGEDWTDAFGISHEEIYYIASRIGHQQFYIPSEGLVVSIFAENYGKFYCFSDPPENTPCDPSINFFRQVTLTID